MTAKEQLIREIEQAPENLIQELLDFLLFAKARRNQQNTESDSASKLAEPSKAQLQHKSKPIWEIFEDFTNELPEEVIAQLPTDGAAQLDHYLYGKPKQDES